MFGRKSASIDWDPPASPTAGEQSESRRMFEPAEDSLVDAGRSNSRRLKKGFVGAAIETAAGSLPGWLPGRSVTPPPATTPSFDRQTPGSVASTPSTTTTASKPSVFALRRNTYDELNDGEDEGLSGPQPTRPASTSPFSSWRSRSGSHGREAQPHTAELAEPSSSGHGPDPGNVGPSEAHQGLLGLGDRPDLRASPIRRMWAQLTTSQSLIDFDDDVASDVLAQRQAAAARHSAEPSARPPQEAPTDLDRLSSEQQQQLPPPPPRSLGHSSRRCKADALIPADRATPPSTTADLLQQPIAHSWLPISGIPGLAKGSRLYNRLPSDDHAQALAVDDSAMDLSCQRQASCGARPSADPWPPRQHLRTGSSGQITPIRGLEGFSEPASPSASTCSTVNTAHGFFFPSEDVTSAQQGRWQTGAVSVPSLGSPEAAAMDSIFEPRGIEEQPACLNPVHDAASLWHSSDLESLRSLTGHEVLAAMSVGVGVRKKWITHMSPVAARDAPRTHRHLRCHLVGSQVVLSYMHKGFKGFVEDFKGVKDTKSATVQAVQVPGGVWVKGATISVYTPQGVLALEPAAPGAFMLWAMGFNAVLAASHTRRPSLLLSQPLHIIPRDPSFAVLG